MTDMMYKSDTVSPVAKKEEVCHSHCEIQQISKNQQHYSCRACLLVLNGWGSCLLSDTQSIWGGGEDINTYTVLFIFFKEIVSEIYSTRRSSIKYVSLYPVRTEETHGQNHVISRKRQRKSNHKED